MSKEEKERAKANKESADAKKQEAQHSKTVSQETKKTLDNVKETGNQYKVINDEFQSYADAINAANLEIQGSTSYLRKAQKEYDGLTSLANKLADNQKEFNELSVEDLNNIKDKSEERRKELALLKDGLELEEKKLEKDLESAKVGSAAARAIQNRLDKTRALIAANADGLQLESSITEQAQKQLDLEAKIASKAGLTGSLIKSAEGAMKKLGIESKIVNDAFSEANAEMRKMVIEAHQSGKAVSSGAVAAKGFTTAFSGLTKALTDPLAIFGFIVAAIGKADKRVTGLQKRLGLSREAARGINAEMSAVSRASGNAFLTSDRLLKTFSALTDEIGMSARVFSNDALKSATILTEKLHMSAGEARVLTQAMQANGQASEATLSSVGDQVTEFNKQNKTMFSTKDILSDVANVSKATLLTNKSNVKALASAATEARKLGMNLNQVESIGESLLDFESSIAAEMEAQLMLGKNINLSKAREAALTGDTETLTKEIGKQEAIFQAFRSGNVLQQQAAAKALGMSREELAGMVHQQELVKLGAEGFKDAYGESAYEQLQAQTAQEKFNDILNKTMGLLADLVTPIIPIVDLFTKLLKIPFLPQFLALGVAVKAVGGSLTGVVSGVSKMGKGIMDAAKNSRGLLKNFMEMAKTKLMGEKIGGQFMKGGARAPAGARAGITGKGGLLGGLKEKITPGKESKLPSMDKSKDLTKNTKGMDPKKGEGIKGFLKGLGDGLAHIGKKAIDVIKGAGAIAIAGLALGGSFALALMMVKDVDPAKMIAFSGSLTMLGLTLALLGKIGSSVIQGALAMGILAVALIPAAYAFSLLSEVDTSKMIAFSIAVPLLGLAAAGLGFLAPFIFAGAAAIAALGLSLLPMAGAFALLGQVDIIGVITSLGEIAAIAPGLAVAGLAFTSLGAGLMSLGVGALFALPGLAVLAGIASIGSSLQAAGTGVRALAENIGLLKDNLNELEVEKLNELQGLLTTAAIAAPMLALAGGLGQMVAGITGGQSGGNDAVAAKLDELIAVVKEGGDVFIDGSKAGNALVLASSKSS